MNIYFAGSIRGGREDVDLYSRIIRHLQTYGEVLTEHVADPELLGQGEQGLSDQEIHDRDMDWLRQSDVIVADVTVPSLGVGYEVRAASELKKNVLCLYRPQQDRRLSAMISGCPDIKIRNYKRIDDAIEIVNEFFQEYQLSTR
ncbi:MAG: nucleoside 2-deoxyribosyltransferase [Bacteroidales bacterium]